MPHKLMEWVEQHRMREWVGLRGTDIVDSKQAHVCQRIFDVLMLLAGIWLLVQWQIESIAVVDLRHREIASFVVWGFFLIEILVMSRVVTRSLVYCRQNWLLPFALVAGIFYIALVHSYYVWWLVNLQVLLGLCMVVPSLDMLRAFFTDGNLKTTLLASLVVIVIFGLVVAGVDPNINTPWDGVWWALATVSTVGYGDVVPTSFLGRLIGAGLVVLGLGMFVVITANFLALFLKRETKALAEKEVEVDEILAQIKALRREQVAFMERVDTLLAEKR